MTDLYTYQKLVRTHIQAGRNVIVHAPTGSGKTRAALYPFFEHLDHFGDDGDQASAPLPLTCRYAVPMRVLATQFERESQDYFDKLDRRGARLKQRYHDKLGIKLPAIQTGETPEDAAFESPLTFCTIDQLLASFIGAPFSLSPGRANLNVGAMVGSYLILDEFHLYPLDPSGGGARTTTLAMLKMLDKMSRFVLMTATFSTALVEQLGKELDAAIVRVSEDELAALMHGRKRTIRLSEAPLSPETILAAHDAARARGAGASLVVCNTVGRAQAIFRQLRTALEQRKPSHTRLMLLHSRFTPADRRAKSSRLEKWLGEANWQRGMFAGTDAIVVGTQVVEVGLNISAGVLHTELAPANSIIQRAGRCARFAEQVGEVIVYPVPPREDGKVSFQPYEEAICVQTWKWLSERIGVSADTAQPLDFLMEQQLIDAVHTVEDRRMLAEFAAHGGQIERTILETLATHERGKTATLIRNVSGVSAVVHAAPEDAITVNPFAWEAFSLHPGTLRGAWEGLKEQAARRDAPWVIKQLIPLGVREEGTETDNSRDGHYTWQVVRDAAEIPGALRLAIHPTLATYDDQLGFQMFATDDGTSSGWQSQPIEQPQMRRVMYSRKQGSYIEHIKGLMSAYDWSVRRELAWVASRLEKAWALPTGAIDHAIRLAIACHDVGKLAVGWQSWAHEWQRLLVDTYGEGYAVQPGREFLAKTDALRDWEQEKQLKRRLSTIKPPPHACAGVQASQHLIGQRLQAVFGDMQLSAVQMAGGKALMRATLSAIARHHAPTATSYDVVRWSNSACDVVAQALSACRHTDDLAGLDLSARASGEVAEEWLTDPRRDGARAAWLGFVLVRALRLCDQRAERDW